MHISYSAVNRIAELHSSELPTHGNGGAQRRKAVLSDARPLSDAALLQHIHDVGWAMDREQLAALVQSHCSAEEIAKTFLDHWRPGPGEEEAKSDWVWFALTILWERWFPEVPNFERIDDKMQRGYELGDSPAQCELWGEVWKEIVFLRNKARSRSLAEFDQRFGGTQSIFNWVQDFEIALGNVARDQSRFHEVRARFCEEFSGLFGAEGPRMLENMRRAWAESVHALGDRARSDAMFREWLTADPGWGWGWVSWSDLSWFPSPNRDLSRSEAILQEGLAIPALRDRDAVLERLALIYQDQGRMAEAKKLEEALHAARSRSVHGGRSLTNLPPQIRGVLGGAGSAEALGGAGGRNQPAPVPPSPKVGRNEPCPCGSQKKYKRCCGA